MKVKKHHLGIAIGIIVLVAGISFWLVYNRHQETLWQNGSLAALEGRKVYYGPGKEPFKHPTGITVEEDYIYVVDSDNHRIRMFDKDWTPIRSFGGYGKSLGKLGYPMAVTVNENQQLVVTEVNNGRVQVFSKLGESMGVFPQKASLVPGPSAMTSYNGSKIYIFDRGSQLIRVFDSRGKLLGSIGKDGRKGTPRFVMGMDVTGKGKLLVADSGNRGVRIYSPLGLLEERLMRGYNGVPDLTLPRGIAAINENKFALVDSFARKVFILEKHDGRWESRQLNHNFVLPDSADYRDGKLYVTDRGDSCVVVFDNIR